MKSTATLLNLYTSLAQNTSGTNQTLGLQLMSDEHRDLLQKFFDNEKSFYSTTVGGANLNLSSAPNAGATSATLTFAWPYPSCQQQASFSAPSTAITATTTASLASGDTSATLSVVWAYTTGVFSTTFSNNQVMLVSYTNGSAAINFLGSLTSAATTILTTASSTDTRFVNFTNGSTGISWQGGLNGFASTMLSTVGVQRYLIPAVISKLKIPEIFVGQLRYVPAPVETVAEWRVLNTLPYTSNITNYFFIFNGAVEFFPVPSSSGLLIQFDYKARVPDFSTAFLFSATDGTVFSSGATAYDYQVGTISGTVGSTSITGSGTKWVTAQGAGKGLGMTANQDVSFYNLYLNINPLFGDGIWYPISQFNSDTSLTLATPIINGPNLSGATYSIGQLPLLSEDFHDMIPKGSLRVYFGSVKKDKEQYGLFDSMYKERYALLADYAGTKSVNIDLGAQPMQNNPNLFIYGN